MVSEAPREQVEAFGLKPAPGLQEALALAEKAVGDSRAPVTVLPDAVALVIQ
jgi:hypothetical protein